MTTIQIDRATASRLARALGLALPLRQHIVGTWEALLPSGAKLKMRSQGGRLSYRIDGYAADGRDVQAIMWGEP